MAVKIIAGIEKRTTFHSSVCLDRSRDTAILIRQSGRGANIRHYESRLLQESLIPFVMQVRGEDDLTHIRIYDEGAGVSGRKGIDKRRILRQLHYDLAAGFIGDIVLARADRLFRDKHFDKVSTFTMLAEQMGIKVIVPTNQGAIVYDLTKTKDLQTFQQDMQAAYAYIENQIGYMNRARDNKMARGLYAGGCLPLPYVLVRDMPKEEQVPVIYQPWLEPALDLFKKFADFHFETSRLARYIEEKPYLFAFMEPSDLEVYKPVTNLRKVEGGYTISTPKSLAQYLSNLSLGGYALSGRDEAGNTLYIAGAFAAAIPLELLEPAYAAITGHFLDGTPFTRVGSRRHYRHECVEIEGILHGLLQSDDGATSAYAQTQIDHPIYCCLKGGYLGTTTSVGLGRLRHVWTLPCREVDTIVLDRLIALAEYDNGLVERVKTYFETASKEGEGSITVLDTAIAKTQNALKKVSRTIAALIKKMAEEEGLAEQDVELDPNDPLMKEYRQLSATLRRLKRQRDEAALLANEDPTRSITDFYHVLSHLRSEFTKQDPQTKKDIMKKLIEEVKINALSPHLYTLHITWIQPMAAGREDVALFWRSDPLNNHVKAVWTEEEEAALRTLYPDRPRNEIMQAIPTKTPGQIKKRAGELRIRRPRWHIDETERFYWTVCYADLQAAAAFTETVKERSFLWAEINRMAERTKRGQLTPSWFLPVDMISFVRDLCATNEIEGGLPRGCH
jgi:hypothetical protein